MDIKIDENSVIVFDLDDTLYNELDYLLSAYKSIAQRLEQDNWKPLYATMISLYRSKKNVFDYLVSKYSIKHNELIDAYRYHKPDIKLFEGVQEVMNAIKSKKGKIGIITDGRTKTQMAKIESLGITSLIDKIIISENLGTEKPDANNYKAIEEAIEGNDYWYIADNLKKDFVSPNDLGWHSIALIDNGKNIHFQASEFMNSTHTPNYYITDYKELNIL